MLSVEPASWGKRYSLGSAGYRRFGMVGASTVHHRYHGVVLADPSRRDGGGIQFVLPGACLGGIASLAAVRGTANDYRVWRHAGDSGWCGSSYASRCPRIVR